MLMDTLYEACSAHGRRVHFHEFMLEVHTRIHQLHSRGTKGDVLPLLVREIAEQSKLLCFDEFQVTDVADAMVMARLFTEYFRLGGTVIATSNRAPDNLQVATPLTSLPPSGLFPFLFLFFSSFLFLFLLFCVWWYSFVRSVGRSSYN